MNYDDELRRSLDDAANSITPGQPATDQLIARAHRRRRMALSTGGVVGAVALLAIALVALHSRATPESTLASGDDATVTSPVEGHGGGGTGGAPTTTQSAAGGATGTGVAPPASTVYPHSTTTTSPPTTTSTTPTTAGDVVVTQDDADKTVTLHTGQRLIVNLSGQGWDYTEPASGDEAVLHRDSGHADAMTGDATATFTGATAGSTVVSSTKDAPCRKASPPCMTPSYLWQVTVRVV